MKDSDGVYQRKSSPYWWCWVRFRGKQKRMSTGIPIEVDRKKAVEFRMLKQAEIMKGINPDYNKTTWQDLKKAVIQRYEEKGNRTLKDAKRHLKNLGKHFDGMPVVSIDRAAIGEYRKKRLKHVKQATVNRELSTLRLGLRLLVADDKILKAPKVDIPREDNERQRYLTREEYSRFILALEKHAPWLTGPVQMAVATGWRRGTIMKLAWNHVNRREKLIIAPGVLTKNKQPVVYPYDEDPTISELIELRWQVNKRSEGIEYVFLNKKGTDRIKDFRKVWEKACQEAGLGKGYGAGPTEKFTFHDLKRTNFVWSEEHGLSRSETMSISGTKSDSIWKRYNIVDMRRMKEAIARKAQSMGTTEAAEKVKQEALNGLEENLDELIDSLNEDGFEDYDKDTRYALVRLLLRTHLLLKKHGR